MTTSLGRRLFAEFLGTGLLVTVVVGSGIAAQQLSPEDVGLQLLENSTATVFGLTRNPAMSARTVPARMVKTVGSPRVRIRSLSPVGGAIGNM